MEKLREEDRFRFANELRAFITVEDGRIVDCGYLGGGLMGSTMVNLGAVKHRFQAVQLADIQREPERGDGWVRFVQTCGGRTGVPAPRRVRRRPFVQWQAPLVWTTLSLTLYADGRAEHALVGASRFPRHWVYGGDNRLSHKSGLTDFKDWYRKSFGKHSPWGDEDSEALVSAVESALETALSAQLMQGGGKRRIERFPADTILFKEGEPGTEVLLILDGIVRVERGGERLAEYGPGALLGERAHLEGGVRTSSNIAVTPCRRRHVRGRPHRALASGGAVLGASPRGPRARLSRCASASAGSGGRRPHRAPISSATAGTPRASRCRTTTIRPTAGRHCCSTEAPACAGSPSSSAIGRSGAPSS